MVIEGNLTSSVDWLDKSRSLDLANVSLAAPNQTRRTTASATDFPYFLDTGTATHITPSADDFLSLRPISSRSVRGVGGSKIYAVGVGDVKLRIARGYEAPGVPG